MRRAASLWLVRRNAQSVFVTNIGPEPLIGGRNREVCSTGANPGGVSGHDVCEISGADDASVAYILG